jgi:hypothetical protein
MKSMFGIRITPDADRLRPFRACLSWLCLNSEGRYRLDMRLRPFMAWMGSPEGAGYAIDGHCPSDKKKNTINSPERA